MKKTIIMLVCAFAVSNAYPAWDKPGADRFTGDVAAAVQDYKDIPLSTRNKLQLKMKNLKNYDDIVTITKTELISSKGYVYNPEITDMHFGSGIIKSASRDKWKDGSEEVGLVFIQDGYYIIVPTVCNNVARITRNALDTTSFSSGGSYIPSNKTPIIFAPLPSTPAPGLVSWPTIPETTYSTQVYPTFPLLVYPWQPSIPGCCGYYVLPIPAVPEPPAWVLLGFGIFALAVYRRSKNGKG